MTFLFDTDEKFRLDGGGVHAELLAESSDQRVISATLPETGDLEAAAACFLEALRA